jgi:hypothetical protein
LAFIAIGLFAVRLSLAYCSTSGIIIFDKRVIDIPEPFHGVISVSSTEERENVSSVGWYIKMVATIFSIVGIINTCASYFIAMNQVGLGRRATVVKQTVSKFFILFLLLAITLGLSNVSPDISGGITDDSGINSILINNSIASPNVNETYVIDSDNDNFGSVDEAEDQKLKTLNNINNGNSSGPAENVVHRTLNATEDDSPTPNAVGVIGSASDKTFNRDETFSDVCTPLPDHQGTEYYTSWWNSICDKFFDLYDDQFDYPVRFHDGVSSALTSVRDRSVSAFHSTVEYFSRGTAATHVTQAASVVITTTIDAVILAYNQISEWFIIVVAYIRHKYGDFSEWIKELTDEEYVDKLFNVYGNMNTAVNTYIATLYTRVYNSPHLHPLFTLYVTICSGFSAFTNTISAILIGVLTIFVLCYKFIFSAIRRPFAGYVTRDGMHIIIDDVSHLIGRCSNFVKLMGQISGPAQVKDDFFLKEIKEVVPYTEYLQNDSGDWVITTDIDSFESWVFTNTNHTSYLYADLEMDPERKVVNSVQLYNDKKKGVVFFSENTWMNFDRVREALEPYTLIVFDQQLESILTDNG